jgi:hypothetical protein
VHYKIVLAFPFAPNGPAPAVSGPFSAGRSNQQGAAELVLGLFALPGEVVEVPLQRVLFELIFMSPVSFVRGRRIRNGSRRAFLRTEIKLKPCLRFASRPGFRRAVARAGMRIASP